jgi:hypothetical protein
VDDWFRLQPTPRASARVGDDSIVGGDAAPRSMATNPIIRPVVAAGCAAVVSGGVPPCAFRRSGLYVPLPSSHDSGRRADVLGGPGRPLMPPRRVGESRTRAALGASSQTILLGLGILVRVDTRP